MARRPIPPHGSYARANGSPGYRKPCKCEPCLIQRRRYDKRWKVQRDLGRTVWIDATEANKHLQTLRKTRTWTAIAEASGVAESNLFYIISGERTTIHVRTHRRILAVQPLAEPQRGLQVSVLGSQRRLQALMSIGHSVRSIAEYSSVAKDRIHDIALGLQPTVRQDVAERIAAVYEQLKSDPPALNKFTKRTRNLAAARGWRDPLWWEDMGGLDDPAFDPDAADRVLNFHERAQLRREEIIHLAWHGETPEQILDRLNGEVSISTVRQIVQEWRTGQKRDRRQVAA